MTSDTQQYDIAKIRQLLLAAFTAEDLRRFCYYRPTFRPIVDELSPSHGLAAMVDKVIAYCETHLLLDELLAGVREVNPRQYARFEPQLRRSTHRPPASTTPVPGPMPTHPPRTEEIERYVDFDLHITSTGQATAKSDQGEASAAIPVEVPSTIQQSLPQIEANVADSQRLKDFGRALYDWLFPGPIHTHFQVTEAVARNQGAKVRIRLRVEAQEIASLPLEFMCREVGGYLAVNPDTVLSRYLQLPLPSSSVRPREGPLHMLAIVADVPGLPRLDPEEWEGILRTALANQLDGGQMTLRMVKRATRREIRTALLEQKPHIVQFLGHGYYESGKGHLALLDGDTGRIWSVDDEQFAGIFMGFDDHLGLVCLAACESAASDDPQGFGGIAPKLVEQGVPAVMAMQYKVRISVAKLLLEEFYTAVAARKPLDWATQLARNQVALQFGYDDREFGTPVLYMRARDGDVF
ncbi:MAG: CHAT domain-containing protein [Anaerolineae bacterium]